MGGYIYNQRFVEELVYYYAHLLLILFYTSFFMYVLRGNHLVYLTNCIEINLNLP